MVVKSKTKKTGVRKVQPLFGDDRYPDIPIGSIEIVGRPEKGDEHLQLFFNPRPEEDFTPESMAEIRDSIRLDGLLQNLVVRAVEVRGELQKIELVAGERRLRTLLKLVADNVPVYCQNDPPERWMPEMVVIVVRNNRFAQIKSVGPKVQVQYFDEHDRLTKEVDEVEPDDLRPTRPASQVYSMVPCKVLRDCSDKEALRIATTENFKHRSLSVAAQIALAERLVKRGLTQEEIMTTLGTNITWVSQTLSFRHQLPEEAFEGLLSGRIKRHVAVGFLSYAPADRQKLYEATVKHAEAEMAEKAKQTQREADHHEDMANVEKTKAKQLETQGQKSKAAKHRQRAEIEEKKATKAKKKLQRAKSEKGLIKQSHLQAAAAGLGVAPKKSGKILTKPEIEALIVKLDEAADGEVTDPVTKNQVPADLASLGATFLRGVLNGLRDPFTPIRNKMISDGHWDDPSESDAEEEGFEEPSDDSLRDMAEDEFEELPEEFDDYREDSDDGEVDNWD